MNYKASSTYMLNAPGKSNVMVTDLAFYTDSTSNSVSAFQADGLNGGTFSDLKFTNMEYGLKIGSGATSYSLDVDNIDMYTCRTGIYLEDVETSTFDNMNIDCVDTSNQEHCIYIEGDVSGLEFTDVTLTGGGGYCLQLYISTRAPQPYSDNITFTTLSLDASTGRRPLIIGAYFSYVDISGLDILGTADASAPMIIWGGDAQYCDIDTIDVESGGLQLHGGGPVTSCTITNGTYGGSTIGTVTGCTVTNVSTGS
jgi:hypothetical protein